MMVMATAVDSLEAAFAKKVLSQEVLSYQTPVQYAQAS
jgi:hypothetical protein